MNTWRKVGCCLAFAAGVSFAALADEAVAERSISIVASETLGAVKLVFGEASSQDTLYLHVGYGTTDGGDKPAGWDNFIYVADITADMTEYDCVLPSGWGTTVKYVRYFLTTENPEYAFAYEYINFKGNNASGAYFKTDYTPIPSKTHIVTDFKVTASRNMALFCSRGASSKPTFTQFFISGTGFRFDCGPETAAKYQAAVKVSVDTQYRVESGSELTVLSADGSTTIGSASCPDASHTSFTAPTELYLFASHNNRSTFGNCACGEARSVRIYESDAGVYDKSTLKREYVPVVNPSTGKGALYDTVTHQFIEPTTTSANYACEFVNLIPCEYVTAGSSEPFAFVPRTLEVVSVSSADGTTKATLAVSTGNLVSEAIVLAFGACDYGAELSAWPTNEILSVVSPAAQQLEFEMPSCWNTAACSSARFFLVHPCSETMIDDMAQVATRSVFASSVSASVVDGSVKIKVTAPEDQTWYASVAYGKTDMGRDPAAWGANTIAGGSGTGPGDVACPLPADWRKTMKAIRVFLSTSAPLMTYSALKGDGKAFLNLGRKGVFGDTVAFKFKNSVVGGNAYLLFGARTADATTNNFSITGGAATRVDYSDYEISRLECNNTGDAENWYSVYSSPSLRQLWKNGKSIGTDVDVVDTPFETPSNLGLFNVDGPHSLGSNFYSGLIGDFELRHIEGSVTNDVMRLVPVYAADIGKYGMFDEVQGKLLLNAASSGAFSAEGAVETGLRAYPAYKCSGVSDPVNRGGLILMVR